MKFEPDSLIESWREEWRRLVGPDPQASKHLDLEVAAAHNMGRPLGENEPVPGCNCIVCLTYVRGGSDDDVDMAELIIARLTALPWAERFSAANIWRGGNLGTGVTLPSVRALVREADRRVGDRPKSTRQDLPVDRAREIPILDVAHVLGLTLRRVGRSYRGPCPVHEGEGPNFSIDAERNRFKCFVCDASGDGIELYMRVRQLGFSRAIRELTAQERVGVSN